MRVVTVARKPLVGSVVENVIEHGVGGFNVDACRIPTSDADAKEMERAFTPGSSIWQGALKGFGEREGRKGIEAAYDTKQGRWPSNVVLQGDAVVADLGEQSGYGSSHHAGTVKQDGVRGFTGGKREHVAVVPCDTGTTARYFKQVGVS